MTTILVNDNKMYGDGQMTGQHISSYKTKKIVNFGTAIVGGAGRWASVVKFHQWVYENLVAQVAQEDHPFANIMMPEDMVEDDFMGLVLYPDGTVIMFEGCKNSFEHEQPVAIGSGADFAIACAHNGLDGKVAIETAAYFDTGTGGEIQVEDFDNDEDEPFYSKEDFEDKSKEEILAMLFGEEDSSELDDVVSEPSGVMHFDEGVFELTVYSNGKLDCCDDEPLFTSFVETQDEFGLPDLKRYADLLGVKFPHNIGQDTLAQKLDEKVKEIVDSLNK
uniref:HslV family peptidase n=1 Tax=Vibrio phage P018-4 TaxID=3229728 RepID=A0AB39AJP4_9CAUD